MITISQFEDKYTQDIIDIVLHFQNDGTRPIVSVDDQPDLLNIADEYINKGGNFWIAKNDEKLIGTIGIMPYNKEIAVLKKFFVYEDYQGKPNHVGRKLYDVLLTYAKEQGYKIILLDTPRNTERAHKFYIKAGFKQIKKDSLPIKLNTIYEDNDFLLLEL